MDLSVHPQLIVRAKRSLVPLSGIIERSTNSGSLAALGEHPALEVSCAYAYPVPGQYDDWSSPAWARNALEVTVRWVVSDQFQGEAQ